MIVLYGKELDVPEELIDKYREATTTDLNVRSAEPVIIANSEYDPDNAEDMARLRELPKEALTELVVNGITEELKYFGRG